MSFKTWNHSAFILLVFYNYMVRLQIAILLELLDELINIFEEISKTKRDWSTTNLIKLCHHAESRGYILALLHRKMTGMEFTAEGYHLQNKITRKKMNDYLCALHFAFYQILLYMCAIAHDGDMAMVKWSQLSHLYHNNIKPHGASFFRITLEWYCRIIKIKYLAHKEVNNLGGTLRDIYCGVLYIKTCIRAGNL